MIGAWFYFTFRPPLGGCVRRTDNWYLGMRDVGKPHVAPLRAFTRVDPSGLCARDPNSFGVFFPISIVSHRNHTVATGQNQCVVDHDRILTHSVQLTVRSQERKG